MKVSSRPRPIRTAYLLEECEHSDLMLDAIFQHSFGCWGGRFHLIIPCENGAPLPDFVPWLKAYDPDLIYSYCDLTEACIEEIHETIYPSYLTRHKTFGRDKISVHSFNPEHKIPHLTVETIVPYASLPAKGDGKELPPIIDAFYGQAGQDRFVQSNFGGYTGSIGHSFSQHLNEFCVPTHILNGDELQPRQKYGLKHLNTIADRTEILNEAKHRRVVTVARLSATNVPRLNFRDSDWSLSFNLIVGDSFLDRITYWNARSLFPRWRDEQYVDLILPEQDLVDTNLINSISEFLKQRNHVSRDQNSANTIVTIRSSSVNLEKLELLSKQLKGDGWIRFVTSKINSVSDHIPGAQSLEHALFVYNGGLGAASHVSWIDSNTADDHIDIEPPKPDILQYCPLHMVSPYSGAWAVEIAIPRMEDYSKYQNVTQNWALPKKLRLVPAFKKGYQLHDNGAVVMPRVSLGGYLSVFADVGTSITNIRIPSDFNAIRTGLTKGRDWWPFVGETRRWCTNAHSIS